LDFGFATPTTSAARLRTVVGTLIYAAPEVFDGFYCPKCDLWSVGVVLYQFFCGSPPFETSDVTILRSLHRDPVLTGDSLFRGSHWRDAPRMAQSLIRGLLTVDPALRLSAHEASSHQWFTSEANHEEARMSRCNSLRRNSSFVAISALKRQRSYFMWDLADVASDGLPDEELGA